jgi:hypothetical protein
MLLGIIEPGLSPKRAGNLNGIDAGRLPPSLLVAGAVHGAMMRAAERDGEFVARFAAERPRLQVAKMMRIGWFAAAHETRLLGDIAKVFPVAVPTRGRDREGAKACAFGKHKRSENGNNYGRWLSALSHAAFEPEAACASAGDRRTRRGQVGDSDRSGPHAAPENGPQIVNHYASWNDGQIIGQGSSHCRHKGARRRLSCALPPRERLRRPRHLAGCSACPAGWSYRPRDLRPR